MFSNAQSLIALDYTKVGKGTARLLRSLHYRSPVNGTKDSMKYEYQVIGYCLKPPSLGCVY